jgi:hypothetical protein
VNSHFLNSGLYLSAAAVCGLLGGYSFYRLWRRAMPRSRSRDFWCSMQRDVVRLLTCKEPSDIWVHYRSLLTAMASYISRATLGLFLGLVPMAALYLLLAANDPSARLTQQVEAYPASVVRDPALDAARWTLSDGRVVIDRDEFVRSGSQILGQPVDDTTRLRKIAFCRSAPSRLLFELMLFETHPLYPEDAPTSSIIVRPRFLDSNPFWPYLNDLDFWFFVAAIIGSTVAAVVAPKRR